MIVGVWPAKAILVEMNGRKERAKRGKGEEPRAKAWGVDGRVALNNDRSFLGGVSIMPASLTKISPSSQRRRR